MYSLPSTLQVAILAFAVLTVLAAYSDVKDLTIPNRYCLAIATLFPIYALQTDQVVDWPATLGLAGGLLLVGFLLFARRLVGAGDVKLAAAVALWAGPDHFLLFTTLSGIAGGGLALLLWFRHRLERAPAPSHVFITDADPDFAKRPMPYGVAIAAGGLYVAFTLIS